MNDGIPVPFFGKDAMTAPALAQLALKYECEILPCHVKRTQGCSFVITFEPPIKPAKNSTIESIMTDMNKKIEGWIRQSPEQWLWLHRRWPKEKPR